MDLVPSPEGRGSELCTQVIEFLTLYSEVGNSHSHRYKTQQRTTRVYLYLTYKVNEHALTVVTQICQIIREIGEIISDTDF